MPNLFTLPGPRNGPNNFFTTYEMPPGTSYTVAAGTTIYADLFRVFYSDHNVVGTFDNRGTIWNISTQNVSAGVGGFYIDTILNSGVIIADAPNGNGYGVSIGGYGSLISNSGSIWAIGAGNSIGVEHYGVSLVLNSGLIAAYAPSGTIAGVGSATGIAMFNGGDLVNGPGASILAEGIYATAVLTGRGSLFASDVIQNDGRIEAHTLGAEPSYGIRAGGTNVETFRLVNNGLIRADIAWSSYSTDALYGARGADLLTNNASGSIIGRIETGWGADTLVNFGSITGDVALGDEDDLFDTSTGTWTGAADMGWHDDIFIGSAAGDVATGNRGNDLLSGNGGNDLLLGGSGDDQLAGGLGNDGLYGELGADHLITDGGDRAYGGEDDDLLEAGSLDFALISGGEGHDTLRFDMPTLRLDLGAAIASGRLDDIEHIALDSDQQLAVRAGDAAALAHGTLEVSGVGTSQVILVGAWIEGPPSIRDGLLCRSFTLGSETVYVEASVALQIAASAPVGFAGLLPVAGGAAAPLAGSLPGGDLYNPVTQISGMHLDRNVTVERGETWYATNLPVIVGYSLTAGLTNHGAIRMTNDAIGYRWQTIRNDVAYISNTGTISSLGVGGSWVDTINIRGWLANSGTIEAVADTGSAFAVEVGVHSATLVFDNSGTISARSNTGAATAAQIDYANGFQAGPIGTNSGLVQATGGAGTTGLRVLTGGTFVNDGVIEALNSAASGATDATAIVLWNNSSTTPVNQLINHGTITGVTAVRSDAGSDDIINSGYINGAIQLGVASDVLENSGFIFGRADLGDGADLYLGSLAKAGVDVVGGAGIDLLVGGAAADRLDGGSENDLLLGGGGADILIGGAGADRFVYTSASDSVIGAADTIQGFESGIDRIDLGALAPSNVTLGVSGSFTTVTAQTAAGTVTILVSGSVSLSDVDTSSEIQGGAGDDTLMGTSGNDQLDGGPGVDFMVGGAGNDIYVLDNQADRILERAGGGIDQVLAYAGFTLAEEVENVTLMAPVTVFGNWLDNVIRGSSGSDVIFSGGGNDILIGGVGADTLSGGLGADVFIYESAADSSAASCDTISGFEYGVDKINLTGIKILSINWTRVLNMWDSYEEVTIQTPDGPMVIRVNILNIAPSGLSMSDFILSDTPNDFNGDGRSDILWRDNTGAMTTALGQANGGFASNAANFWTTVPTSWSVIGTGDFNGDGRDDLLWRNPATGEITNWLGQANGAFSGNDTNFYTTVATSWQVAGIGDFNGDGRDDLLWRNPGTGATTNWLAQSNGGFAGNDANALNTIAASWHVQPDPGFWG